MADRHGKPPLMHIALVLRYKNVGFIAVIIRRVAVYGIERLTKRVKTLFLLNDRQGDVSR